MKSFLRRHQTTAPSAPRAPRAADTLGPIAWLLGIHKATPQAAVDHGKSTNGQSRFGNGTRLFDPASSVMSTGNFTQPGIDIPNMCYGKIPEIALWNTGFHDGQF